MHQHLFSVPRSSINLSAPVVVEMTAKCVSRTQQSGLRSGLYDAEKISLISFGVLGSEWHPIRIILSLCNPSWRELELEPVLSDERIVQRIPFADSPKKGRLSVLN